MRSLEPAKAGIFVGVLMILVPSQGSTVMLHGVVDTAQFGLLGPFFGGQFLVELRMAVMGSGTVVATFGAVVGESNNASVESWRSGHSIVDRSTLEEDGQPVIRVGLRASTVQNAEVAMGRRVEEGPLYMVVRLLGSHASITVDALFSVTCLELGKVVIADRTE